MSEAETNPAYGFTELTHKAGGVLLMLAGAIGAIVGLGMLVTAVTAGGFLGVLNATTATILGVIVLVFSVIEFAGAIAAFRGSNWYGSMTAAMLGIVTVFTLPLDLIGAILFVLGEGRFEE